MHILKESIDARRKPNIYCNINVAIEVLNSNKRINSLKDIEVSYLGIKSENRTSLKGRPVIVGFGPAGMFMALKLAKSGLRPIVVEQGDTVDIRQQKIDQFWKTGDLDIYSNVHFGEGGAGTFSDGKLNSNLSNEFCKLVTNELILHGAPKEIFYKSKPHIGTDNLRSVVRNIREEILRLGGEIFFGTRLEDILIYDGQISGIRVKNLNIDQDIVIDCNVVVLAIGHSAKNVFKVLKEKGVIMEQKPFAMGVRIEQLQRDINISQYGRDNVNLPAADYKLVEHLDNGSSVFTFCMCPGGEVVASSSEKGTVVTNGMSYFARNKENANSALLVNIDPKDFGSTDVLAGFDFQSRYEKLAFALGGRNYNAPCESVGSFLNIQSDGKVINASYKPGVTYTKIEKCLPEFVVDALRVALPRMDRKIKNFANPNNVLTAIESKSSCPVKIVRMDNNQTSIEGLFAVGEGAGYAGGIMSSAQDGLKIAESVIEYLCKK